MFITSVCCVLDVGVPLVDSILTWLAPPYWLTSFASEQQDFYSEIASKFHTQKKKNPKK